MNFKDIPVTSQPVYAWLWNGKITEKEIEEVFD